MRSQQKIYGGAALIGLIIAVLAAVRGRGSFDHCITLVIVVGLIGLPAAGVAVIAWVCGMKWKAAWIGYIRAAAIAVVIVTVIPLGSIPVGIWLAVHDVRDARLYCDRLIPLIEQAKSANGKYPESVEALTAQVGEVPVRLRERPFYEQQSDGEAFTLYFVDDPGHMFGRIAVYHSTTKAWVHD